MKLADAQCELISRKAIRYLQQIDAAQGGLANAWDELCVQVQDGESIFWDLYIDLVLDFVRSHIDTLEEYIKQAIWLQTTQGKDWCFEDEETREPADVLNSDIAEYVLGQYIHPKADNWTNKRITAYLDLW